MQEKIIEELRQELKAQIEENKELNDSITWWKNRYEAQVKINKEHQKLNGELRKEIDGLVTVIDLAKQFIRNAGCYEEETDTFCGDIANYELHDLINILEKVNEE